MVLTEERPRPGVALLTLNLPDRRNAMTEELTAAWVSAVERLRGDDEVRCVVVTGAGSAFCAGGDLSWLEADGRSVAELRDKMLPFYRAWLGMRSLQIPSVAVINGAAVGDGSRLGAGLHRPIRRDTATLSRSLCSVGNARGHGHDVHLD